MFTLNRTRRALKALPVASSPLIVFNRVGIVVLCGKTARVDSSNQKAPVFSACLTRNMSDVGVDMRVTATKDAPHKLAAAWHKNRPVADSLLSRFVYTFFTELLQHLIQIGLCKLAAFVNEMYRNMVAFFLCFKTQLCATVFFHTG
jgi:hypothetical protein